MAGKKSTKAPSNRAGGKNTTLVPKGKGNAKGELTDQELDKASGGVRNLLSKSPAFRSS